MSYALPAALSVLILAATACDRRDAYPPSESRTTTDTVTAAGAEGDAGTGRTVGAAHDGAPGAAAGCDDLVGEARRNCDTGTARVPEALAGEDDAPAAENRKAEVEADQ